MGIPYKKARDDIAKVTGKGVDKIPYGLSLRTLAKIAISHHVLYRRAAHINTWPIGTIVFLSDDSGRYAGAGHYILKVRNGWMDPWATGDSKNRKAKIRPTLPTNTYVKAALVPIAG